MPNIAECAIRSARNTETIKNALLTIGLTASLLGAVGGSIEWASQKTPAQLKTEKEDRALRNVLARAAARAQDRAATKNELQDEDGPPASAFPGPVIVVASACLFVATIVAANLLGASALTLRLLAGERSRPPDSRGVIVGR